MAETETTEEVESTEDITSLSDMFDDSDTESAAAAIVEDDQGESEPEPEATETTATAEPEAEEPEPEAEPPSAEQGQLAALMAERDKRKKAEKELEELRSKAKPETVPDPIEDPEGYANYIDGKNEASALNTKISISRDVMMSTEPEYERLEGVFMGLVLNDDKEVIDPNLLAQFRQASNPAKFAIETARKHERIEQLSDPKYQENLEAKIREKILAEMQAVTKKGVSATEVPDLITGAASSDSTNSGPVNEVKEMFADSPL